jgi:hypothetical protein
MEASESLKMAIKKAKSLGNQPWRLLQLKEKAEKGLLVLPEGFIVAEIDSGALDLNHLPHNLDSSNCFIVVPKELGPTVKVHNYQDGVEITGQGYVWSAENLYDPFYTGDMFKEAAIDYFLSCYREGTFSLNLHLRE